MEVDIKYDILHGPPPAEVYAFAELVHRYDYKPGFRAIVSWRPTDPARGDLLGLHIIADMPDVRRRDQIAAEPDTDTLYHRLHRTEGHVIEVQNISLVNLDHLHFGRGDFGKHVIEHAIDLFERHERDEWLTFDGKRLREPHGHAAPLPGAPA